MTRLRPAEELLAPAVADTVTQLKPAPTDTAAVRLAQRYAALIDRAEQAVADAENAIAELDEDDIAGRHYVTSLRAKVEAQAVLAELGPKLLAVLESLAATPAARAKLKGGAVAGAPSRLQGLRNARTA